MVMNTSPRQSHRPSSQFRSALFSLGVRSWIFKWKQPCVSALLLRVPSVLSWLDCGQWLGSWHRSCLALPKVCGNHCVGTVAIVIELRFCPCWLDTMASKTIWLVRCHNLWIIYEFGSCHTLSVVSVFYLVRDDWLGKTPDTVWAHSRTQEYWIHNLIP